jgi:predicted transcriptional regulator
MTPTEAMNKLHLQASGWPVEQIKVVKPSQQSAIIPSRRDVLLKRINDMETEIGRLGKLLAEVRADVLHLTVK